MRDLQTMKWGNVKKKRQQQQQQTDKGKTKKKKSKYKIILPYSRLRKMIFFLLQR